MQKRLISIALVLVLLISVLASCKKEQDGEEGSSDNTNESISETVTDAPAVIYQILTAELESYSIIYPEGASSEISNAINNLVSAFSLKFGIQMRAKDDNPVNFKGENQIGEYEIIIDDCRRDEANEFLSTLEYGDKGYKLFDKKLVIASHDPVITANLINEFSSLVRKADKTAEVFYSSEMDTITRGSYTYDTITIGGVDISEYRIVYPAGKTFEAALAKKIWRSIAEECGSMLEIVSDKEAAIDSEILIGKTNRSSSYTSLGSSETEGYMTTEGKKVLLCGNNALGNANAANSFIALFAKGEPKNVLDLKVSDKKVSDTRTSTSMTFNLTADGYTTARASRVSETIVRYLPDTIGLQECSADWKKFLLTELGDYYEYIGTGRDAEGTGLSTAILYAKNKLTVKDSGTKWLSSTPDTVSKLEGADANYTYTYALFTDKNGTDFIFVNAQLSEVSSIATKQAKMILDFIYANRDIAIILAADLNFKEGSETFNALVCEFMRHSAAISSLTNLGSFVPTTLTDTLLVYDKYIDVYYTEVATARIDGAYASKSYAAYIEYSIDMKGTSYTESGVTSSGQLTWIPDRDGEDFPHLTPIK